MFRLVVLAVLLLCASTQPVKKSLKQAELARAVEALQKQIQSLKDVVQRQKDAEKKEEAHDVVKKEAVKFPPKDAEVKKEAVKPPPKDAEVKKEAVKPPPKDAEVKKEAVKFPPKDNEVNDLLADLEKAVKDDYTEVSNTKKEVAKKLKEESTVKAVKDTVEVAKVVEDNDKDVLDVMMRKEEQEQQRKEELEIKNDLLGIRKELHHTKDSFVEIEKQLDGSVTSSTVAKVEEVRTSLKDVMGALHNLKSDVETRSKWKFQEIDSLKKRKDMIKDVKMKLDKVDVLIKELHKMSLKKDEEQHDIKKKDTKEDANVEKKAVKDQEHVDAKRKILFDPKFVRSALMEISHDIATTKHAFVEMKKGLDSMVRDHPDVESVTKSHLVSVQKDMSEVVEQLNTFEKMMEQSSGALNKRSAKDDLASRSALLKPALKQMKAELKDAVDNINEVNKMADTLALHDQAKEEMEAVRESVLGIRNNFNDIRKSFEGIKDQGKVKDPKIITDRLHSIGDSMGSILKEYDDLKSEYLDKHDTATEMITSKTSQKVLSEIMGRMRDQLTDVAKDVKELHELSDALKDEESKRKEKKEAEKEKQLSGKEKNIGSQEKREEKVTKGVADAAAKVQDTKGEAKKKNEEEGILEDTAAEDETSAEEASFKKEMNADEKKSKREAMSTEVNALRNQLLDVISDVRKMKKAMKETKTSSAQKDSIAKDRLEGIKMKLYDIQERVKEINV